MYILRNGTLKRNIIETWRKWQYPSTHQSTPRTYATRQSRETYHPGRKEDTPQRDGGPTPWPAADLGNQHPYKNQSDTSTFHSRRQELPEDLPTQTPPTPEYEQQWAPNTIQTVILICNAKGIPNEIAQKTVRHNWKTVVLEVYAWWWLIRAETCSILFVYVILILLLCRQKVHCVLQ